MLLIRPENDDDLPSILSVVEEAFHRPQEANLVESLHRDEAVRVSLVALIDDKIVGHILFSPVTLETDTTVKALGLAPLAVLPPYQRQGIGSQLVQKGLETCEALGYQWGVVLGDPNYYSRFGFEPASEYGLKCSYDVPPEAFRVKVFNQGSLTGKMGVVFYDPAFDSV